MGAAEQNIALVHDWLTGMRGGEKCLEPLCRHFPNAPLYTLFHESGSTAPAIEQRAIKTSFLQRLPGARRHYRYLLPLMPWAAERLRIDEPVRLVLSFSHAVAKSVRAPDGIPHVCYCFTPMRYVWQMREHYFPTTAGKPEGVFAGRVRGGIGLARSAVLDAIQAWDRETSRRVTHFVACSQTVAERIWQCYGRTSRVIHPPVDTQFYTPAPVKREEFYLCVSALVPYKRIDLAIRACRRLGRRLVVIGRGPEMRKLADLAGGDVQLLGWQSNEVIRDYLRRCRALLFPGEEDFGIVPVEAQACGTPVIAFGRGGATETVVHGEPGRPGTGIYFGEQSVEALSAAMLQLEEQPERACPQLAREHAVRFSAARYERAMLDLLCEIAG
jgi:glycosyltransferase involved in cell wall biosynthesis